VISAQDIKNRTTAIHAAKISSARISWNGTRRSTLERNPTSVQFAGGVSRELITATLTSASTPVRPRTVRRSLLPVCNINWTLCCVNDIAKLLDLLYKNVTSWWCVPSRRNIFSVKSSCLVLCWEGIPFDKQQSRRIRNCQLCQRSADLALLRSIKKRKFSISADFKICNYAVHVLNFDYWPKLNKNRSLFNEKCYESRIIPVSVKLGQGFTCTLRPKCQEALVQDSQMSWMRKQNLIHKLWIWICC